MEKKEHIKTDFRSSNSEKKTLIISDENCVGKRLDLILIEHFKDHSRSYFQFLIQSGQVLVNGKEVKKRQSLRMQDVIEITFIPPDDIDLEPENIPLDILYEDDHILAVNKPKEMVVHPGAGNFSHTFVNALLHHCKNLPFEEGDIRPGIVHRLDKMTTGVLVAAKTIEAHRKLIDLFSSRKVKKSYLALTYGKPKEGLIEAPIGRDPHNRKRMCVKAGGKEARTTFRVLGSNENISWVLADLHTGRTHQIRVHLAYLQAPIVGDEVYGSSKVNQKYSFTSQQLHAYKIAFTHPITKEELEIIAPLPSDTESFCKRIFPKEHSFLFSK